MKNFSNLRAITPVDRGLPVNALALSLFFLLATSAFVRAGENEPQLAAIKTHVETLASPEYGGRAGEVAAKSRTYLIEAFQKLKLEPLFNGSWYQDIPGREAGSVAGRNVGAKIIGSDPKLKDEWVIVAAHFDHVGVINGVLFPGADDNASAVAMLLETARCLQQGEKPKRSVMLIGFDLEERGLVGSRYFVEHSPVPLDRVALFVTADMIGRALGGVAKSYVFVMGTEHYPPSLGWVKKASEAEKQLDVGILGADLLLIDRSDYGPFRSRKIPFLFFSTGENPCYHRPTDVAATLDYPKAEAISRVMYRVILSAINAPAKPTWTSPAQIDVAEAKTLRDIFKLLLANRDSMKIGRTPVYLMESSFKLLDTVIERGSVTASERASLIRVAQIVMAAVF